MNNVVFMVDIQGYKYNSGYEYSAKSWDNWTKKHGYEFIRLTKEIHSSDVMRPNWHKFFAFDVIREKGIEVDKLLVVDADTIVHPDTPDFFKLCDNNICGIHENGSYDWTLRSIENYSKLFKAVLPWENYINSGFILIDSKLSNLFDVMKELYEEKKNELLELQELGVGTDQTPFNYMIQELDVPLKILPYKYNMTCMPKSEILGEDMLHTKLGYIYHFNGIGNKETAVPYWMEKTYKYLYGEVDD